MFTPFENFRLLPRFVVFACKDTAQIHTFQVGETTWNNLEQLATSLCKLLR